MKIGDLVMQAENAYFANDVKLDVFDDPEKNAALTACYKFTYRVPNARETPQLSSIKIMQTLQLSLQHGHDENRHLVLAYYGHGKSHLALTLANYFGKPLGSPEIETMLQHIAHASDESVAANFRDFKVGALPYLVILLRGDEAKNLPQQFLVGLEKAILRLPGNETASLPFWFAAAERFLSNLTSEQAVKANELLTFKNMDVSGLIQQVRDRHSERYDLCVEVFVHLYGTRPDFGGEINLEDAVKWAVQEYCGEQAPRAAGIVVIFDEFLAFLEDYYKRMQGGGASSALQSLLNGISSTRGKSLFVGFSQRDPDQALHELDVNGGGRNEVQVLQKELNRLPQPNRYQLYSSLETVLDGYLRQDETLWSQIYDSCLQQIQTASNRTRALMGRLYEDASGWTDEQFEEIVTKGCFPLHPLTTTLYCNLQFAGDSRRMLQFALDALKECKDSPVVQASGQLNWVYATCLADFFQHSLLQTEIGEQYASTRSRLGGALTPLHIDTLKGMLLYSLGGLKLTGRFRYPDALEMLTGHSAAQCLTALDDLESAGAIEKNEALGIYLFVRGGETHQLKEWLAKKRATRSFEDTSLRALLDSPEFTNILDRYMTDDVKLGHADDWVSRETLLPASLFNVAQIKKIAPCYAALQNHTIRDGVRGAVIRVFAEDEAELRWLEAEADKILDEAMGDTTVPLPVIVCIPHSPRPALVGALKDLLSLMVDGAEAQREFGSEVCSKERTKVQERVKQELKSMRQWESYHLPQMFRAHISGNATGEKDSLKYRLSASYRNVYQVQYTERHERFFTQYKADNPTLRRAVSELSKLLTQDRVGERTTVISAGGAASTAGNLVELYLRDRWGLVDRTEHLLEPTSGVAQRVWQHFDTMFPIGDEPGFLRKALIPLFNPPFGLDSNQIVLMFCAWYGMHRRTMEFQEKHMNAWATHDFNLHLAYLDKPKLFLERICLVAEGRIRRWDADQQQKENEELIKRARERKDYTLAEAQADLGQLRNIIKETQQGESLREQANRAARILGEAIDTADSYIAAVQPLMEGLKHVSDAVEILKLRKKAEVLIETKRIRPDLPTKIEVLTQVDMRLDGEVTQTVQRYAQITSLRQHDSHRDKLRELQDTLSSGGKRELSEVVSAGLRTLEQCATKLDGQKGDEATLSTMRSIRVNDTLAHLREGLQTLNDLTPLTEVTKCQLNDKRRAVQDSITRLEDALRQRGDQIDRLVDAQAAYGMSQTLLQEKAAYAEAPEALSMDALLTRCKTVERTLKLIEKERTTPLQTPEEARSRQDKLRETQEAYGTQLTSVQLHRLSEAQTWLDNAIETTTGQAEQWLRQIAHEAETEGDAAKLLRSLREPRAFLPADCTEELEKLRDSLQSRLDTNEIEALSRRFRKLSRSKRAECLIILSALLDEEGE